MTGQGFDKFQIIHSRWIMPHGWFQNTTQKLFVQSILPLFMVCYKGNMLHAFSLTDLAHSARDKETTNVFGFRWGALIERFHQVVAPSVYIFPLSNIFYSSDIWRIKSWSTRLMFPPPLSDQTNVAGGATTPMFGSDVIYFVKFRCKFHLFFLLSPKTCWYMVNIYKLKGIFPTKSQAIL